MRARSAAVNCPLDRRAAPSGDGLRPPARARWIAYCARRNPRFSGSSRT
jgi:hypothetical protein